jgi:hypothetical protein
MQRKILAFILASLTTLSAFAQFTYGTTGLLHMPTAEMQRDKTFLFGGSFLNINATPKHFDYDTFNYYADITFFPWLEVSYTLTLHYAHHGSQYFPPKVWGKYCNQDRMFSIRVRLIEEGYKYSWMPQIVLGVNDPGSHKSYGGGDIIFDDTGTSNAYFTRFYLAATKHLELNDLGQMGLHAALLYSSEKGETTKFRLPAIGADFRFNLDEVNMTTKAINKLALLGEFDGSGLNVGAKYRIWRDNINFITELYRYKYFRCGIYFKLHLT